MCLMIFGVFKNVDIIILVLYKNLIIKIKEQNQLKTNIIKLIN